MPFSYFPSVVSDHVEADLLPGAGEYIGLDVIGVTDFSAAVSSSFSWSEVSDPDVIEFLEVTGGHVPSDHRDYHYRFIVVPNPLTVNNPSFNSDIPFHIWNTFPFPDEATAVAITGSAVLTTDAEVGSDIRDFQWKLFNIQIAPGEAEINAFVTITWAQGIAELNVIGQLIIDIPLIAEDPTSEVWKWTTSITTTWDGTEQRIRMAPAPRRTVEATYIIDEDDLVELSTKLRQSNIGKLAVPLFQYGVIATQDSPVGTDEIFFDPTHAHFRVGDILYARDEYDDDTPAIVHSIVSFTPTGCIINGALGRAITRGFVITLAMEVYTSEPQQAFKSKSGTFNLIGQMTEVTRPLLHENATITELPTFNDRPIITSPILADITEGYKSLFEVFDNTFGLIDRESSWVHPKFTRAVKFGAKMVRDHQEYDQWMLFFDTIAGAHKSFYLPSSVHDMKLHTPATDGEFAILVTGNRHSSNYEGDASRSQIEIQFADRSKIWYNITQAVTQSDGNDLISLDVALPDDVSTNPIIKISYIYWVRLITDEVQVQYRNNRAYFSFAVLGVEN